MIVGTAASVVLVLATILIHYEFLRSAQRIAEWSRLRPRLRIVVMLMGAFLAHTVEIYVYAVGYMVLGLLHSEPVFTGVFDGGFEDYLYFSATSYSTLGFGDIAPMGPARLLAGTEALNGLVLITWTASVTYLMMDRYWRRD